MNAFYEARKALRTSFTSYPCSFTSLYLGAPASARPVYRAVHYRSTETRNLLQYQVTLQHLWY